MSPASLAFIFGLTSAITWGAGDYSGGVAAKSNNTYVVVFYGHLIGLILIVAIALLTGESVPGMVDLLWGGAAGIAGMIGIVALYTAISRGNVGVVAPVAAIVNASLPIILGTFLEGLPRTLTLLGFALALIAVWLLASTGSAGKIRLNQLGLPIFAGVGLAFFLIFFDRVTPGFVYWPMAAARGASVICLVVILLVRQVKPTVATGSWIAIILVGIFDLSGNTLFGLATQAGRLDIATALSSLYPASTVLLAWWLEGERLSRMQLVGVVLAFAALILIAL